MPKLHNLFVAKSTNPDNYFILDYYNLGDTLKYRGYDMVLKLGGPRIEVYFFISTTFYCLYIQPKDIKKIKLGCFVADYQH